VDPKARPLGTYQEFGIEEPIAVPSGRQDAARDVGAQGPDPTLPTLEADPQRQQSGPEKPDVRPTSISTTTPTSLVSHAAARARRARSH
jgi:hypothetical protein